jgi:hypothetical protein
LIAGAAVLLLGALLGWALWPEPRDRPPPPGVESGAAGLVPGDRYVGARACAACHPGEYAAFTGSGHARTLRPAAAHRRVPDLDGRGATDPEQPDVSWRFVLDGGRFHVERGAAGAAERSLIDYAFGSGQHAVTFTTLIDADPRQPRAVEHRLTYYTEPDAFGLTPGQQAGGVHAADGRGYAMDPATTRKCFGCHSTRLSADDDGTFDPATLIPNVSCERCHGPGRDHVAAARRGATELTLRMGPESLSAEALNSACGECHRDPAKAPPGLIRPDNTELARFQPVGLSQARCATESGEPLSCTTCHDPHSRARAHREGYVSTCLKCHDTEPRAVCPVSPRENCIGCHMPGVDSGQNVLFTDHWIRVREPADSPPGMPTRAHRVASPLVGEGSGEGDTPITTSSP